MIKAADTVAADNFIPSFICGENVSAGDALAYYYSDKKVYKASAAALNERLNFIGFAVAAATTGNRVSVNVTPIEYRTVVDGSIYYLSDTQGALSTSAGTISREVGVGMSTTRLFRWKNGRVVSPQISTGGNFTCPVNAILSYYQAGAYITVGGVAQTFSNSDTGTRHVVAHVKAGDVVTFANGGGPSTYGPNLAILDI